MNVCFADNCTTTFTAPPIYTIFVNMIFMKDNGLRRDPLKQCSTISLSISLVSFASGLNPFVLLKRSRSHNGTSSDGYVVSSSSSQRKKVKFYHSLSIENISHKPVLENHKRFCFRCSVNVSLSPLDAGWKNTY